MRFFLFGFFILVSVACCAAVYMTVDQQGNTTYSDVPSEHAKPVDFSDQSGISTIDTTQTEKQLREQAKVNNQDSTSDKSKEKDKSKPVEKVPYQQFSMTNPVDQQTFQNDRSIPVDFSVAPALQEGDMIQVYVDGSPAGGPHASTHLEVGGLNRGTHQFFGVLMDDQRKELLRTPPVTVYIHYASAVTSPAYKVAQ